MTDDVLRSLSPRFDEMYSDIGRPSISPEQLLRALLVQSLYTIRSERLLMEEIDYSILFRWFIGLRIDEEILVPDRLRARIATGCCEPTWPALSSMPWCAKTRAARLRGVTIIELEHAAEPLTALDRA